MEEERYLALLGYIKRQEYPACLTKSQKYVLRRASKNYQVVSDKLPYIDLNVDGSTFKRLVLHGRKEVDQVFMECHLTTVLTADCHFSSSMLEGIEEEMLLLAK